MVQSFLTKYDRLEISISTNLFYHQFQLHDDMHFYFLYFGAKKGILNMFNRFLDCACCNRDFIVTV